MGGWCDTCSARNTRSEELHQGIGGGEVLLMVALEAAKLLVIEGRDHQQRNISPSMIIDTFHSITLT